MTSFHIVVAPNETLDQISRNYGVPMSVLRNINAVGNENRLPVGQKIYLREEDVLGVQVLLLDTDRNPIKDQKYVLEFACRVHQGVTDCGGLTQQIYTDRPTDRVRILIERLDGSLKEVTTVDSGYRNKLVTVLSPRYRANAKTEPDKSVKPGELPHTSITRDPLHKVKQPATLGKQELGPQVSPAGDSDNRPVAAVRGDIPELDLFLDKYDGRLLSEDDIKEAAEKLGCEPGIIFAIARQESSRSSFFKIGERSVPKILYERHLFKKHTTPKGKKESPFAERFHDICGPQYHRTKRNEKKEVLDVVTDRAPVAADIFGPEGLSQYKRLLKAYQLNSEAALLACSWGKFQILGENFAECGHANVQAFVRLMGRNEVGHLKAFLAFAQADKKFVKALRQLEFEQIAACHNGSAWKTTNPQYADNLKKYYKEYCDAHPKTP